MADQTAPVTSEPKAQEAASTVGPTAVDAPPSKGTKVIRYTGLRAEYLGPKGSHKEITKAQFKEAGVADPFANSAQDLVTWSPSNGYQVPKSVFTEAAVTRLLQEDDLEEATAE